MQWEGEWVELKVRDKRREEREGGRRVKKTTKEFIYQAYNTRTYIPVKLQSDFLSHWLGSSHVSTGEINKSNSSLCEFFTKVWDLSADRHRRCRHP
jgi:hypothetical protein